MIWFGKSFIKFCKSFIDLIRFGKSFIKFCKSFIDLIKIVNTRTCSSARVRTSGVEIFPVKPQFLSKCFTLIYGWCVQEWKIQD